MPRDQPALRDRFRGCLLGVAVGDALGAPFEGQPRADPDAIARWAGAAETLRWTDDTHMTMGLARSLLACGGISGPQLAVEFARSYNNEPWRGYGAGPPKVFAALASGDRWDAPARQLFGGQGSFGNGAAMRVAPVGMAAHARPDTLERWARESARVTHAHETAQQAAVLQAAAIGWLVTTRPNHGPEITAGLVGGLRGRVADPQLLRQLDRLEGIDASAGIEEVVGLLGNGIAAAEAVPAALHAFLRHPRSLPDAVLYAVRLGGDTDTIASMTGALAGALLGASAIPEAWLMRLEAADELGGLADGLLALSQHLSHQPAAD